MYADFEYYAELCKKAGEEMHYTRTVQGIEIPDTNDGHFRALQDGKKWVPPKRSKMPRRRRGK